MYATLYPGDPTTVLDGPIITGGLASGKDAQMAVGTLIQTSDGKVYKYVLLGTEATDVVVKGDAVYYTDLACTTVTPDETDALCANTIAGSSVAGIWVRAKTTAALQGFDSKHYAFIQVGGVAACVGDGSVAAGDVVRALHNSTNGVLTAALEADSTGKYKLPIGVAMEADTATSGAGGTLQAAYGGTDGIVAFYCRLCNLY